MGCIRTGSRWRWPNGIVPYTINADDFPTDTDDGRQARADIADAIATWNANTNVRIQPRSNERNYAEFVAGDEGTACSSAVGMQVCLIFPSCRQEIHCNPSGSVKLVHEIGHALGLWHEQSREDRGLKVEVFLENVRTDKRHNYDRHVDDGTDVGSYTFDSIMHYRPRTFAVDWRPGRAIFGQASKDAPSLASFGGELHLVHLGEESNNIWHSWTTDGESWVQNNQIPNQLSKAPPAIAVWNGALHMVHLGDESNDIWQSRSLDRRNWTANTRATNQENQSMKSKASPALAAFNGELHMVHIGDSSNDLWHAWTSDGENWTEQRISNQLSKSAPALATFGAELHMVHLGDSSNDLWHSWTTNGRDWTENERIPNQKSRMPPALCEFGDLLHMAHIGDESATIWHSEFQVGRGWRENDRNDNNESWLGPALAVFDVQLHSVHRGKSSSLLVHTVRDTSLPTLRGPALPDGGFVTLGGSLLTPGDIDAVNGMYP